MFAMGIHVVPEGTIIMGDGRVIPPHLSTPELKACARHVVTDATMIVGTSSVWMTERKKEELDNALRHRTRR
jgi:hypothetical protein